MPSTGGRGRGGGDDAGSASSESGRSASKGAAGASGGSAGSDGSYRGYSPSQVSHLGRVGLGAAAFGTDAAKAARWAARMQRPQQTAATISPDQWGLGYEGVGAQWGALNDTLGSIDESGLSSLDKSIAKAAAKRGNIGMLSGYGIDTSGMTEAYGGAMDAIGGMFGKEVGDVHTPHEALTGLIDRGYAQISPSGSLSATPSGTLAALSTPVGMFGKIGGGLLGSALGGPIGGMIGSFVGGNIAPSEDYSGGVKDAAKAAGLMSGLAGLGGPVSSGLSAIGSLSSDIGLAEEMSRAGVSRPGPMGVGGYNTYGNNYGIVPSGDSLAQYTPSKTAYIDYSKLYG